MSNIEKALSGVKTEVERLDTQTAPVRTLWGLSENKFAAAVLAAALLGSVAWVWGTLRSVPSVSEVQSIRARQDVVIDRLNEYATFRAVTEQRLSQIEKVTSETNVLVRRIDERDQMKERHK